MVDIWPVPTDADVDFIVYAVNHIEQAERDFQTALELLLDGQSRLARYVPEDGDVEWSQAVRAFLARQEAPDGK